MRALSRSGRVSRTRQCGTENSSLFSLNRLTCPFFIGSSLSHAVSFRVQDYNALAPAELTLFMRDVCFAEPRRLCNFVVWLLA